MKSSIELRGFLKYVRMRIRRANRAGTPQTSHRPPPLSRGPHAPTEPTRMPQPARVCRRRRRPAVPQRADGTALYSLHSTVDGIKPYHRVWRSSSAGRRWQAEQPAAADYLPRPKALGACSALAKPHLHCPKTAPVRSTRYWLQGPDSAEGADLVTGGCSATGGSSLHASVL